MRIKRMIDYAYNKTGMAQSEFTNVVNLADDVKDRETKIKVSMAEQADGGQRVLSGLDEVQGGVESVMTAAKELQSSTNEVIRQISNIQL